MASIQYNQNSEKAIEWIGDALARELKLEEVIQGRAQCKRKMEVFDGCGGSSTDISIISQGMRDSCEMNITKCLMYTLFKDDHPPRSHVAKHNASTQMTPPTVDQSKLCAFEAAGAARTALELCIDQLGADIYGGIIYI